MHGGDVSGGGGGEVSGQGVGRGAAAVPRWRDVTLTRVNERVLVGYS